MGNLCDGSERKRIIFQSLIEEVMYDEAAKVYLRCIIEQVEALYMEKGEAQIKYIQENRPAIIEYFKANGWTESDFDYKQWSKHSDPNFNERREGPNNYYLGSQKNELGQAINCNGVRITDFCDCAVWIQAFDQDSKVNSPSIAIHYCSFDIIN